MPSIDAPLWPLAVYLAVVLFLVAAVLVVSYLLGQRHRERTTGEPYESGSPPTGSARLRFSVGFYLVAMFFVVFDVESIFLFAWAIAWRDVGWTGYIEVVIFVGILMAALVYLWRVGALDWRAAGRRQNLRAKRRAHGVS
jgi:NADH-quinone oxidoreductase subunit A